MMTTGIWRRWAACWGLTALPFGATPAHAMTSVPYGGLMAEHSGKCLAIEAGSTLAGARVLQAGCRHIGSD